MTNLQFVKNEIRRYNTRHGTEHNPQKTIIDIDIWENFASVMVDTFIGYAKRNPNCDEPNNYTGLSIATFRALRRIDRRTP